MVNLKRNFQRSLHLFRKDHGTDFCSIIFFLAVALPLPVAFSPLLIANVGDDVTLLH